MTEWEKAQNGYLYDANYDAEIIRTRTHCADLCYAFNQCKPSDTKRQRELLEQILGSIKGNPVITAPFYCDYGCNISIGENFYTTIMLRYWMEQRLHLETMYLLPRIVYSLQPDMQSTVNKEIRVWRLLGQLLWVTMSGSGQMYLYCRE